MILNAEGKGGIVMDNLPLECDCGCKGTEQKNICNEEIDGALVPVEYYLYCKECGKYLGYFAYGHWEY